MKQVSHSWHIVPDTDYNVHFSQLHLSVYLTPIPDWDGRVNTLERFEEDVLIFTHARAEGTQSYIFFSPKLVQQFPKGSPQRELGLELLKSGMLQLEDGATQQLKLIRLRLGKDLQQDVSEHYKRFLHRSARLYQQSMQHYIAEDSNLQ